MANGADANPLRAGMMSRHGMCGKGMPRCRGRRRRCSVRVGCVECGVVWVCVSSWTCRGQRAIVQANAKRWSSQTGGVTRVRAPHGCVGRGMRRLDVCVWDGCRGRARRDESRTTREKGGLGGGDCYCGVDGGKSCDGVVCAIKGWSRLCLYVCVWSRAKV